MGELSQELKELPMRALLAAAFITYMSAASEVCWIFLCVQILVVLVSFKSFYVTKIYITGML